MKIPNTVLACVLGFAVHATASAQIYESTDAEGVPEFSDTPTPGAAEIELPQTNVVTPVPVPRTGGAGRSACVPAGGFTGRGGRRR